MKLTAQILALYFLLGSLLPGSDFSQLKKAAGTWEHYQLHQELAAGSGNELSFFKFLYLHFWDTNSHQHNDGGQSHQDLPLKTVHTFSPILPANHTAFLLPAAPDVVGRPTAHYISFPGFAHDGAVFRPPILS